MCWLPTASLVVVTYLAIQAQAFRDGDFIQTARKAQFHQQRTNWHDLLGHHCPRFGNDRVVAVPLQKPMLPLSELDDYKLQLSFDGDRHLTPWLKVIGKGAPPVPVVEVELRRSGEELLGVVAKVLPAPVHYQHAHAHLVEEWRNASEWPKHLLVRYEWVTENDVDLDRGLYVLFGAALLVLLLLIFTAVQDAGPKLAIFLQEVAGDDHVAGVNGAPGAGTSVGSGAGPSTSTWGSTWKDGAKAE
uniref:Transmembrane 9 superfamily member n=1 Tax=Chlamydomonas leiostraca TaxID=1034604 RepID=A0A7S0X0S9_9CHLO|mmetsp:Transcript_7522/g.18645  ORF Transcript_7522/g.18645 Transcript_7522/m.18645 type:complete len:245 (+) Transcript_7522:93-827(+)